MESTHGDELCDDLDCFRCKLKSIQFNPYATPSRLSKAPPRGTQNNSWEKGIPTDSRGMPFLKKDGTPMGQKEYAEQRSQIDEHRRRLANSTAPVLPTGSN